jgi:Putative transposase/Transposase zinc-binding domain
MLLPRWEVADVFRRHGPDYRRTHADSLSRGQRRTMSAIERCRSAALGGHLERCDSCGHEWVAYNSCRNRHCPKCQSLARAQWLEHRRAELLPVQYLHVVFTVPEPIAAVAFQNKKVVYGILFRAAGETLRTIACRPDFFLPVRVLSRLFRRLFLQYLQAAFDAGQLQFFSSLESLNGDNAFAEYLRPLRRTEWVVYAKRPFAGAKQVLDYLARYTHRVAISNNRLLNIKDGKVTFRWKDYRHHDQPKTMTLDASEFIRRFLLHVLPDGFMRIRHYGFFGNRHRQVKIARCRELLGVAPAIPVNLNPHRDYRDQYQELTGKSLNDCRACGRGHMVRVEILMPITGAYPARIDGT